MPECDRCGRSTEDGATVNRRLDLRGTYCVVCISWFQERRQGRPMDQASLEDY